MSCLKRYLLLTLILITFYQGGYVHAKALLAQHLLDFAWAQSLSHNTPVKPWPWADTTAIARLSVAKLDLSLIVLDGTSGEAMAFGPGLNQYVTNDGKTSYVIGGHRDTHMKFIKRLAAGDTVTLATTDGVTNNYEIQRSFIVDTRKEQLMIDEDENVLVLVTCYPFEALIAGGPLRFIMVAVPKAQSNQV